MTDSDDAGADFVSLVAHEVRTPLTTIQGGAGVLLEHWRELPADTVDELLGGIDRQARRLGALITDLLELSRLEEGGLELEPRPVPLHEIVAAVVATHGPEGERSIEVVTPGDAMVHTDASRARHLLGRIVENAWEHGARRVEVHARPEGAEMIVTVADDGPGLPEELEATAFNRFVRGTTGAGWGLGLAVSRELAQALGGRLWHERNEPAGSRFSLSLPRPKT